MARKDRLPPSLNWLRAFEASARLLSFTGAARELGFTPSSISQQVRSLEHHLGRQLFARLRHGLRLTAAGEAFLLPVQSAFRRVRSGALEIEGEPCGRPLRLRADDSFALRWLAPRLPRFRALAPEVELRLSLMDWTAVPDAEGVDLEICYGDGRWRGVHVEPLTRERLFPVVAPGASRDLADHTLLDVGCLGDGWPRWLASVGLEIEAARRCLRLPSLAMAYECAAAGMGAALGTTTLVEDAVRAGRLLAPFGRCVAASEAFHLVFPARPHRSPAVEAFCGWLASEVGGTALDHAQVA